MIQHYGVTVFTGADGDPRVHALGHQWPKRHDMSSLRLLGSVGEPISGGLVGITR
jgi:acetyl-CoA synthetase